MVVEDAAVLGDPVRLAAVDRARRVLPALPMPLAGIARLAARLLDAPIGLITLIGDGTEHFAGAFGAPDSLVASGQNSAAYSVCKYMVSADAPVRGRDMRADTDPRVREHPLVVEYGVGSFLGVPLRDAGDRPVGALAVMDTRPRDWTDDDLARLVEVAVLVDAVPTDAPTAPVLPVDLDTVEVLDAISEAFLTLDVDAVVTGWNAAATDLFGFTAAEACGRPVDELLAAEYEGIPVREVLAGLLTGELAGPLAGPVALRARDGRRVHAQVRLTVIHGAGGAAVCVFFTDITAQVLAAQSAVEAAEVAEAAAAEADADAGDQRGFAEALLDSLDEGVLAVGADGRAVVFNRALRALHGLSPDVPPEQAHAAVLPRLHRPDGKLLESGDLAVTHALGGRTVREAEAVVRAPGHADRYLVANATPVVGGDGRPMGAVVTVQDVTQRRRAERFRDCELAVATILNRPGTLADLGPEIVRTVAQTLGWPYASLRLIDPASDTLRRVAEWSPTDFHLHDVLPARIPGTAPGVLATVLATGEPAWVPDLARAPWLTDPAARARAATYAERGMHGVLCAPIRDGEQILGVLTCFADTRETDGFLLTGLVSAVAAQIGQFLVRRRADDLSADLARARADFTALIGHDMRTPLTTIATYTQLLLDDPSPRADVDTQLLEGIDRNVTRLRDLVDGLLDLTALEAGHHTIDTRIVDLAAVLAGARELAQPAADAAGVTFRSEMAGRVQVIGDPDRLKQLADKLLATAIAATSPGSEIHLVVEHVEDEAIVRLTCPGDLADDDFQRFSAANATGTGNTDHTSGIALVLSRVIAERHGGTLTVTTDAEDPVAADPVTTTITVRLPGTTAR